MAVRKWAAMAFVATVLITGTMVGLVGPASADVPIGGFSTQAQRAGLTAAQAEQLQARVNGYLATLGGTQVSANRITIAGVGDLTVAVPGEQYAHDLAGTAQGDTMHGCRYFYFCMYRNINWGGDRFDMFKCGTYPLSNWVGLGSYTNNQTLGTEAKLQNKVHHNDVISIAYGDNPFFDWTPIWYVVPC